MGSRAIDIPIELLPHVDEHSVEIEADQDTVWEALVATVPRVFGGRMTPKMAGMLGCAEQEHRGEPGRIGSTIPGFVVARAVGPAMLALEGEHRYSRYALIFCIDRRRESESCCLRAETRAEFPGVKGSAYRRLVIGSRGHTFVTRRLLKAVKRRAERAAADKAPV